MFEMLCFYRPTDGMDMRKKKSMFFLFSLKIIYIFFSLSHFRELHIIFTLAVSEIQIKSNLLTALSGLATQKKNS